MAFLARPNLWVLHESAAAAQLTYALRVSPAPLTVSIADRDPVLGSLEFVLTNPTNLPISVTSVAFTIQVGEEGNCLTTSTANVRTSVSDSTNWQISAPGDITSGPAIFRLVSQTGAPVPLAPGASVVVEIFNFPTVENPGNTTISIREVTGSGTGSTAFQVTTFPAGFYFNGLSATVSSGSQLAPVAQVATGTKVTLVWNSSVVDVSSFTIYYSDASLGQQKSNTTVIGEWTSPPLTADTVFAVEVTVSAQGGVPLSATLSTSVAVQNPSLVAASVTSDAAKVKGPLTVSGNTGLNAVTATGLTVSGSVGIGTTTPAAKLDVGAALGFDSLETVFARQLEGNDKGDGTYVGAKVWGTQPVFSKSFSLEHHFYGEANNSISFYRGGNVTGGFLTFATNNNTEQMIITSSGKVGIGTMSPEATLDVRGTLAVNDQVSLAGNLINSGNSVVVGGWADNPKPTFQFDDDRGWFTKGGISLNGHPGYARTLGGGNFGYFGIDLGQVANGLLSVSVTLSRANAGIGLWNMVCSQTPLAKFSGNWRTDTTAVELWSLYRDITNGQIFGALNGPWEVPMQVTVYFNNARSFYMCGLDLGNGQICMKVNSIVAVPMVLG